MTENAYQPKHLKKADPTETPANSVELTRNAEERLGLLVNSNPWAHYSAARAQNSFERSRNSESTMEDVVNGLDAEVQALILILLDMMDVSPAEYIEILAGQIEYLTDPTNL